MPEDFTVNSVEFGAKAIPETKRLHGKVFGWQFQDGGRDCERFDGAGIDGGFTSDGPSTITYPRVILLAGDRKPARSRVGSGVS